MNFTAKEKVYNVLNNLDIAFICHKHPEVFTVEEANLFSQNIQGTHCKNLFLKNKNGDEHYLVILEEHKRLNLKLLSNQLGESRLSFASENKLEEYLGLKPGSVSIFGLINDLKGEVKVILDLDLKNSKQINFHPNINTETLTISYQDFAKYLEWCNNEAVYIKL